MASKSRNWRKPTYTEPETASEENPFSTIDFSSSEDVSLMEIDDASKTSKSGMKLGVASVFIVPAAVAAVGFAASVGSCEGFN